MPIGRLFGFEIRVHLSWILILALVAVLVVSQLDATAPSLSAPVRWSIAAGIAAAFLLSVLAHELAHAIVARRRGLRIGAITLYFFGGSTSVDVEPNTPADEAAVAAAGPIVSLVLGGSLAAVALLSQDSTDDTIRSVGIISFILGVLNLILGVVNLVPGFPLDGGRLVRAIWWARTGNERRGSEAAAMAGRVVGWLLMGAGLAVGLLGDIANGLMLALSGWFLGSASRAVIRRLAVEDLLKRVRVEEVMEREVPSIAPQLTVDTFADRLFGEGAVSTVPVVHGDEVVGLIGPAQLRSVGRGSWTTTRAEQLMVAMADVPVLSPGETVWTALDRLRRTGLDGLPVIDASGLLGMVTRSGVVRTIQAQAKLRGIVVP